jgi:predicted dehydrogenase
VSKTTSVAVVGCGYWGPNLIRNFNSLPNCELKAVCDMSKDRLAHMKRLYPATRTETDFDKLLTADIDAVAVATPVSLHFPLAKKSLLAGKHTFIEKPMAATAKECEELVGIAEKGNLTLMIGHTFLYTSPVRKIKQLVQSGDIGEIRYISARRLNLGLFQKDINVVWDLAPHDLSIISYIMGSDPCAVNCQGNAHVTPRVEDVANMSLFFAGNQFAMIHSSWLDPRKVRDMTIVGTKRMIFYDDLEPLHKIRVYDVRVETPPHYDTFAEFQYSYHYGDLYAPYIKQEEPLQVECRHFLDCIRTGETPMTSGRAGWKLVRILEGADQSIKNGGTRVELAMS